jgi:hypothetical protein
MPFDPGTRRFLKEWPPSSSEIAQPNDRFVGGSGLAAAIRLSSFASLFAPEL